MAKLREEVEQKTEQARGRGWLGLAWGIYPTPETMEELHKLRAAYFSGLPLLEALEKLEKITGEAVERLQQAGQNRHSQHIRKNGEEMARLLKEHEERTKQGEETRGTIGKRYGGPETLQELQKIKREGMEQLKKEGQDEEAEKLGREVERLAELLQSLDRKKNPES